MARFLIRRTLLGLLTLLFVSIVVFAATQALPGDAAVIKLARAQTPQALAALRVHFHLNESVFGQYFGWLGNTLQGNLGTSFLQSVPVTQLIGNALGNTVVLALYAAVIGLPLALFMGIMSAVKRGRLFDDLATVGLLVVAALPEFVLGILLILLLSTSVFRVFPAVSILNPGQSALTQLKDVALPAITLALAVAPYVGRMIRASMIEVLESDYVSMARLKGVKEWRVVLTTP